MIIIKRKVKSRLLDIIRNGCQLTTSYYGDDPECQCCVIGSLINATTTPNSPLRTQLATYESSFIRSDELQEAREHLCREFNLNEQVLTDMQDANDSVGEDEDDDLNAKAIEQRRDAVINALERNVTVEDEE